MRTETELLVFNNPLAKALHHFGHLPEAGAAGLLLKLAAELEG